MGRLQRQWGASLAGAALALALLNAPAHAVPSGITVDGTTCTLVDAITAANSDTATGGCAAGSGADTITLQTDVTLTASNNFSYSDNNGLPRITSTITIEGGGHTIRRDTNAPAFRLLAVTATGNLTLHQTTLSGGNGNNGGGAIFNRGTVTVSNSTVAGNATGIQGGAINNNNGGTLTVSNSTLSGNTAARGGGIYNEGGTVTVSNSTLSGNSASNYGGGIYNSNGTLNLARSLISGNSAGNRGTEIYNYSNGTINAANFNLIGYGDDARTYGFAPSGSDLVPSQALAAILNTTLSDNGGGTFTHALVTGSPARDAAGDSGLATDQRGVTRPQGAADDIGAFELAPPLNARINGTDCNLIDAIIAANSDTATGACAAGDGADTITLLDDVTLTTSNNFAVNSDNGLPRITSEITIEGAGHTISRDAGAPAFRLLLVDITGNLTLHQTTLSGGNSQQSGGAIHNLGTVTVNNSTLSGNSASHGGAIFNSYATVTVSNSTLSDNTASFAGGSIYSTSDSTVSISNSTLSGNSAEGGGAIYNYGTVSISNSTLSGNSADQGGGIYNKSGTVSISASTLSDNTANDNGGGINNRYGTLTVSNSTLSGNTASTNGGGINNEDTATVSNSTLSGNSAAEGGGGIYNNGTVTVNNSTLSGNSASNYGGGIYNDDTATISNSTLSGNSAAKGGGIYNDRATLTVSNSTLSGNSASSNGGGILNDRGTLNLARSLISGNSAGSGAEIHNAGGTINAANFNLIGYGGDARSTNFTPLGSDIVPSQALAAILNTTLADNGGDTLTHALVTGSPALDAAGDSGLATDQRGITRPQGSADDIGAFELEVAPATITIVLDTQPNLPTNLGFSGSLGAFLLDDPAVDDSDAYTNTKSFSVVPGAYTVRRNNATGWFLTNITCTPTGKTAINLFQRTAILTVASGDSVTCTYTVQQAARILARAFEDEVRTGSNLGRRNAGDDWLNGWAMNVFRAPNAPVANGWTGATSTAGLYQASFATLKPGDYTVCTVLPAGSWTPTTPNATNPDYANQPCKAVTLAPGQVATVLFGAYQSTVVASEAFTPADELVTDEDTIVNLPYDPAEDETATQEDGLPRLFLPLVAR